MTQLTRIQVIDLANAAYQLEQYKESRRLLIKWINKYPHDLWMRYRLAIVLYKLGEFEDSTRLCELITEEDPEYGDVWGLLAILYPEKSPERSMAAYRAKKIHRYVQKGQPFLKRLFNREEEELQYVPENEEFDILSAVETARSLINDDDRLSGFRIVNIYYRRWPRTIQFKVILGHILNQMGRTDEGMQMIQSAVEFDVTGRVCDRIWGVENPYKNLWPDFQSLKMDSVGLNLSDPVIKLAGLASVLPLSEPLPTESELQELIAESTGEESFAEDSEVSVDGSGLETNGDAASGLGESSSLSEDAAESSSITEEKISIDGEDKNRGGSLFRRPKEDNEGKNSNIPISGYTYRLKDADADLRQPVYVVFSSVSGLVRKYGANNKSFIDQEMRAVADAVASRKGWETRVYYPDEFTAVSNRGLTADEVHNSLVKLDQTLLEKGQMIGALLIVGGDEVVPFFRMKNPISDDDAILVSDAPYGCIDTNKCYEMQWQVGRVPGDDSGDPGIILQQLRTITQYHISCFSAQKVLDAQKKKNTKAQKSGKVRKNMGYCCAAWLTPSTCVYKTISDTGSLLVSPQTVSENFPIANMNEADYAYFNLHGVKGQPNWYGQKKVDDRSGGPTVPKALQISNVNEVRSVPKIVFSECCYGAEIIRRNEKNCISLNMVGRNCHVFIGSTAIAYGSLSSMLVAADLLAYLFWRHLNAGVTAGEAFRRAKKNLATEMEQVTGGLDAEIQKTLLSFVFFGDPLFAVDDSADVTDLMRRAKTLHAYSLYQEDAVYERTPDTILNDEISREINTLYDVGMASNEYSHCTLKKLVRKAASNCDEKSSHFPTHETFVLTYVKENQTGGFVDRSIIRVTVRDDGMILKVAFSR